MIEFILKMILLTTIFSLGWKVAISDGMILESVGKWAENKIENGNKWVEAIYCQWCLPNFFGILVVWPLAFGLEIMPFEWNWKYIFAYPFCVCGSSFLTGMAWLHYLTLNQKREYYEGNDHDNE